MNGLFLNWETMQHMPILGTSLFAIYAAVIYEAQYSNRISYRAISQRTSTSDRTVVKRMTELEELGYIEVVRRNGDVSSIYVLELPNRWTVLNKRRGIKAESYDQYDQVESTEKNAEVKGFRGEEPAVVKTKAVKKTHRSGEKIAQGHDPCIQEPIDGPDRARDVRVQCYSSPRHPSTKWSSQGKEKSSMPITQDWKPRVETCEMLKKQIPNITDEEIEIERKSFIQRVFNSNSVSRDWDYNFTKWVSKGIETTRRIRAQLQIGKNVPEKAPAVKAPQKVVSPEKEVVGSNAGSQKVESSGVYFDAAEIMAALEKDRRRDELFNKLGEAHRAELLAAKERQIRNSDLMGKWLGLSEYGRHSYLVDGVKDDLVANM